MGKASQKLKGKKSQLMPSMEVVFQGAARNWGGNMKSHTEIASSFSFAFF
jgi:hypothetical protein